jgi:hypothetical protein
MCRKESTMDDQIKPISAGEADRAPSPVRAPSWVIILSAVLVAVGVFGRQQPARILAKGDGARGVMRRGEQTQAPSPSPGFWLKDVLLRVYGGISRDRILLIAAGVTFYAILALFPGIGLLFRSTACLPIRVVFFLISTPYPASPRVALLIYCGTS